MDNAFLVGGVKGVGELTRNAQGFVNGEALRRLWALGGRPGEM